MTLFTVVDHKLLHYVLFPGQSQTFALFQSNDARVNDTAQMVSSITSTPVCSESVCLKFWYLMPNQNSKLEVYTATESGGTKSLIYEFKYQSTSRWEEVKVPINTDTPFSVFVCKVYGHH